MSAVPVWVALAVVTVATLAAATQAPSPASYPDPFDRPGATKLFENARVIVWDNLWQKNTAYPIHQHHYDMTGLFLRWGQVKVTTVDGRVSGETGPSARPFDVPSGFFTLKGVTHKEETLGDLERHGIMVELKDPNPALVTLPPGAVAAFPREGARQIFDSARSVIWDYTYQPGQAGVRHFHDKDAVEVFLSAGTLRTSVVGSPAETVTAKAEEARFLPGNRADVEEAVGTPVRVVVIELK